MKQFSINIPEPCGRYCLQCKKTVIDFTSLSDNEIIDLLPAKTGKYAAGLCRTSHRISLEQVRALACSQN